MGQVMKSSHTALHGGAWDPPLGLHEVLSRHRPLPASRYNTMPALTCAFPGVHGVFFCTVFFS
jgi:hypothetical protein